MYCHAEVDFHMTYNIPGQILGVVRCWFVKGCDFVDREPPDCLQCRMVRRSLGRMLMQQHSRVLGRSSSLRSFSWQELIQAGRSSRTLGR